MRELEIFLASAALAEITSAARNWVPAPMLPRGDEVRNWNLEVLPGAIMVTNRGVLV
jgi:hypothetical protein